MTSPSSGQERAGLDADRREPTPPTAHPRPHTYTAHGETIEDPYAWLRDPAYPDLTDADILDYLHAENAYFDAMMAPQREHCDALFEEMKGRLRDADESVPQKDGDWYYWSAFEAGEQYSRWLRRPLAGGEVQVLLDGPALAEGREFFQLGPRAISPDGRYLAFGVDDSGAERFTVRVKDLESGEYLSDQVPEVLSSLIWSADSRGFLYGPANAQWRTDRIRYHRLGSDVEEDVTLFEEPDESFRLDVGLTQSRRWIQIVASAPSTNEIHLLPAEDPLAKPLLVSPRRTEHLYSVEVHDDVLFIHTNDIDSQFRLCTATLDAPGDWQELIGPRADFYLTDVACFRDFFVTAGRQAGLDRIAVHRYDAPDQAQWIEFDEANYSVGLGDNPEYAVSSLRLFYQSMVTPSTVYDYHVAEQRLETRKVMDIPSGYDPAQYATERLMIEARDGTPIPVSIVHAKTFPRDGSGRLFLYGYGAYGAGLSPDFSPERLSLLERGFAFAIAHVRGGDELGQAWYHAGRREQRCNTFNDFVDVAETLIATEWTHAGGIAIAGESAGGELMGVVVNTRPHLWGAVIAGVPFVDVLNTMQDPSLPLTVAEWSEWGNPLEDRAAFDLIRSYSPYDNVSAQAYPPMMVKGGVNDPRVTYWEPAKWVARLRAVKTDTNPLLLKVEMGAGHGGRSGRFEALREAAEEYAFVLWQMGATPA